MCSAAFGLKGPVGFSKNHVADTNSACTPFSPPSKQFSDWDIVFVIKFDLLVDAIVFQAITARILPAFLATIRIVVVVVGEIIILKRFSVFLFESFVEWFPSLHAIVLCTVVEISLLPLFESHHLFLW
jgi:hypothetical protein